MSVPTPPRPRLVVLGAGGRTGRLVVGSALRSGFHVTAAVRSPERAGLSAAPDLDVVPVDARDPEALRHVLRPGDAIVSAVGPSGRTSDGLYTSVAESVVAAAATTGAHRFVGITSSGVREDDPNHPWWYRRLLVPFMRPTYDDMRQMEALLRTATDSWTFVRPGRLVDEPGTGTYRVEDGGNPRGGVRIPRADVAAFVVSCVRDDRWLRREPTITR